MGKFSYRRFELFVIAIVLVTAFIVMMLPFYPALEQFNTVPMNKETYTSVHSESITGLRVLADLDDGDYLVEISVDTRIKNILYPISSGKHMQLEIPHVVKMSEAEFEQLYKRMNK